MAIIVAGKLTIKPGSRDEFIDRSRKSIIQARSNGACEDFSVSPDPIDLDRVNVFEKWRSRADLVAFRDSGPESGISSLVESFDIVEYEIKT
jgi:quinol monooxygenase YgiN